MRLYLSSYRLRRDATGLLPEHPGARAAIVMNALDLYGETRMRNYGREAKDLEELGYGVEALDLREHFDRSGLDDRLAAVDAIWAVGGNAFVLARAMTASGFGAALRRRADAGGFTYGGYSAGACVAGPDLIGIELMDEPNAIPDGYPPTATADALGLVPFRIVPHVESDHPETTAAARAMTALSAAGTPFRAVRDGESVTLTV